VSAGFILRTERAGQSVRTLNMPFMRKRIHITALMKRTARGMVLYLALCVGLPAFTEQTNQPVQRQLRPIEPMPPPAVVSTQAMSIPRPKDFTPDIPVRTERPPAVKMPAPDELLAALTNTNVDPAMRFFSELTAGIERELANPSLDPRRRQILEDMLTDIRRRQADLSTNSQLWANLRDARLSRDKERVARSERELADYLAARLERIHGKTLPPGASLQTVTRAYEHANRPSRWNPRTIVLIVMVLATAAPLVGLVIYRYVVEGRREDRA
jgi:hypothetical protein